MNERSILKQIREKETQINKLKINIKQLVLNYCKANQMFDYQVELLNVDSKSEFLENIIWKERRVGRVGHYVTKSVTFCRDGEIDYNVLNDFFLSTAPKVLANERLRD